MTNPAPRRFPRWPFWLIAIALVGAVLRVADIASHGSAPAPPSIGCRVGDITVDKLRARIDEYGYAHVTGRVTNRCASAVGAQLKLTVYGKNGEILRVADFWPASINNISAGREFPFEWPDQVEGFYKFTIEVISVKEW